jgi:hypothetical protein
VPALRGHGCYRHASQDNEAGALPADPRHDLNFVVRSLLDRGSAVRAERVAFTDPRDIVPRDRAEARRRSQRDGLRVALATGLIPATASKERK